MAIVATACLIVMTGVTMVQARPVEAATNFRTFQHNVQLNKIGAMRYIIGHDPPLMVTGQEFCRNDFNFMRYLLLQQGYTVYGRHGVDESNLCGGLNGAILLVASLGTAGPTVLDGPFVTQAPGDETLRTYICMSASVYLLAWWVCSTHITPTTVHAAVSQSTEMREQALGLSDRAVIVGGDFNRQPFESGPTEGSRRV